MPRTGVVEALRLIRVTGCSVGCLGVWVSNAKEIFRLKVVGVKWSSRVAVWSFGRLVVWADAVVSNVEYLGRSGRVGG